MKRYVDMEDISDGKVYGLHDMVRAGCQDCVGCSDCCKGMGHSIVLDPLDVYELTTHLSLSFEELLEEAIELQVVDGLILPNLKMNPGTDACVFLSSEGRCRIHSFRPGICRIFPLGRKYENDSFTYFLQTQECSRKNRTKVRVDRWIDTKDIVKNQQYILTWHHFVKTLTEQLATSNNDEEKKRWNLTVLAVFYQQPYDRTLSFYDQFAKRMELGGSVLSTHEV